MLPSWRPRCAARCLRKRPAPKCPWTAATSASFSLNLLGVLPRKIDPQPIAKSATVETDPFRLCREVPDECAQRTLTTLQKVLLAGMIVFLVEAAVFFPMTVLLWLNVAFTLFYAAVSVYRVLLIDLS